MHATSPRTVALTLAALVICLCCAAATRAVPIPASGWNVDFILGNGETYAAHQKPENANIWFSQDSTVGVLGLPASGAVTAIAKDFQLQPYTGGTNNVLRGPGTLTLDTPAKYSQLSLLGSNTGGSSPANWQLTLNFTDAPSSGPITYNSFLNWAGGVSDVQPNPQLTSNGTTTGFVGTLTGRSIDLDALGFSGSTLQSIDFSSANGAGGNLAVFALAGRPTPAVAPTIVPIASIDFNSTASPTEAGFIGQSAPTDTHMTPLGDLTVTIAGAQGNFDRGVGATQTHGIHTDLYRDFYFRNGGPFTLTLSGPAIEANTEYELTFYAFDEAESRSVSFVGAGGTVGFAGPILSTADADITSLGQFSAYERFISDGAGVLTISIIETGNRPRINGFEISVVRPGGDVAAVPEPATGALALVGLAGLMLRRRRAVRDVAA